MKKLICIALLLALTAAALAEAVPFLIRNGVEWGMSSAQVLAVEENPTYTEGRENGLDVMILQDTVHLDAACTLKYLFFKDALAAVRAEYDAKAADVTLDALRDRLSDLYGAATPLSPEQLGELTVGDAVPDAFYGWVLYDETLVSLSEDRSAGTLTVGYSDLVDSEG